MEWIVIYLLSLWYPGFYPAYPITYYPYWQTPAQQGVAPIDAVPFLPQLKSTQDVQQVSK